MKLIEFYLISIFSHLSESLNGLSTIKAYGAKDRFISLLEKKIDQNSSYLYSSQYADR